LLLVSRCVPSADIRDDHRPAQTGLDLLDIQQIHDYGLPKRSQGPPEPMQDIELQYNNRARVAEHKVLFDGYARDSLAYRDERKNAGLAELGLSYGPSARQTIDLFSAERDSGSHLTVFIHGGYWQIFEPALFSHMARGVNARGIPMALIGYDLAPDATLAEIVTQTKRACVFLWQRYRRRLVLSGHSAGGHLTACMVAGKWREAGADIDDLVPAGLAISGVFELAPLLQTTMNQKLKLDEHSARQLSPINWRPPAGATVDAWVGGAESEEFLRQSHDFAKAWRTKGADTRVEIVDGANHFTVIDGLADPQSPMTARLAALATARR
jgi:arylformamidase